MDYRFAAEHSDLRVLEKQKFSNRTRRQPWRQNTIAKRASFQTDYGPRMWLAGMVIVSLCP